VTLKGVQMKINYKGYEIYSLENYSELYSIRAPSGDLLSREYMPVFQSKDFARHWIDVKLNALRLWGTPAKFVGMPKK
jgi:hypothetical protein